jgi:hypothetical protein
MNEDLQKELRNEKVLFLLSYREHIVTWLTTCLSQLPGSLHNLKAVLEQYVRVIEAF